MEAAIIITLTLLSVAVIALFRYNVACATFISQYIFYNSVTLFQGRYLCPGLPTHRRSACLRNAAGLHILTSFFKLLN